MGHKSSICFESGLFSVVYNISFVFFFPPWECLKAEELGVFQRDFECVIQIVN